MKIAVVGCGALGSFYGARLGRAGHEVHFLLRSDYETVRRKGVFIHSPSGNFHFNPRTARLPGEIGVADLVLVALKTTANDQFPALLPPLTGPRTAVLTLQNGLGNEEALARLFPPEQILGGLCFVCLNRTAPGVIQHLDHGAIILGEFQRWPEPRTHDFASAFRQAGVPCDVTDNLERTHWEKLVWNIPFNGLGVASAAGYDALLSGHVAPAAPQQPYLTTDRLLAEPRWEALVRELMQEVISAARAQKLDLPDALAEKQIARTRTMGAYRASTLVDFERGLPLELESLFLEPLRRGERAGTALPRLHSLSQILQALDAERERA
jgi:2-dehydropantoate 2-reductase